MTSAYVDTTILVEICLKGNAEIARRVAQYPRTLVAAYALKELRGGFLRNLVDYFNKLTRREEDLQLVHLLETVELMDQGGRKPYRLKGTLQTVAILSANLHCCMTLRQAMDRLKDDLSELILDAWENAYGLGEVIGPISCFDGRGPTYDEEANEFVMPVCWPEPRAPGCCVKPLIQALPDAAIESLRTRRTKTAKAEARNQLKALEAARQGMVDRHKCRQLGDVAIVLFAPADVHILSTNSSDFPDICAAFGKEYRDV